MRGVQKPSLVGVVILYLFGGAALTWAVWMLVTKTSAQLLISNVVVHGDVTNLLVLVIVAIGIGLIGVVGATWSLNRYVHWGSRVK